ncbi:hypothetical protein [Schlesneria sp. DSM 10557]|uniref:hypothetical protein n=1 Tax=Schlesneria sp. DSM 10557 TaxID=3044399 RepID=UPI0035A0F82F
MSRRGRSGPTISLFSFQDIITSVTAIVTVITLLLALDLVQRKQSSSSSTSATLFAALQERLKAAEAELVSLQTLTESDDTLVREAAGVSPAELRNEIARRESAITDLEQQRAELEQQKQKLKQLETTELSKQFDLEPVKEARNAVLRKASELDQQRVQEQSDDRPIFTLPRGIQKEGWLAVIDSKQIAVAPLGRPAVPEIFSATGLPILGSSASANFDNWISDQRLRSAYFLLLVRPDSAEMFDKVQAVLDRRTISYGFDLIDADQQILHPERGAAP